MPSPGIFLFDCAGRSKGPRHKALTNGEQPTYRRPDSAKARDAGPLGHVDRICTEAANSSRHVLAIEDGEVPTLTEGWEMETETPEENELLKASTIAEDCALHSARSIQSLDSKATICLDAYQAARHGMPVGLRNVGADGEDNPKRLGATLATTMATSVVRCPEQENITLTKVIALTMELKAQICKLQGEVAEQKEKQIYTEQLKDQLLELRTEVSEQRRQLAVVQSEVPKLPLPAATTVKEGTVSDQKRPLTLMQNAASALARHEAATAKDGADTDGQPLGFVENVLPVSMTSPRRGWRLGNMFRSMSPCRSPSRSISPNKRDIDDIKTSFFIGSPQRGNSPDRNPSPDRNQSRRLEARIAPRIMSNMTTFVDGQIQNLELRMAEMEASIDKWRQSSIPDGSVDGMCPSDLQMLCGMNVVKSGEDFLTRAEDSQNKMLLGPSAESVWDLPPCSTSSAKIRAAKSSKSDKGSSWKRFFRRAKAT